MAKGARTYAFCVSVGGLDLDRPEQLDRLYDDAVAVVVSEMDGLVSLDVEVEAAAEAEALQTFWAFISRRAPEVTVHRVDEGLVTTSAIASRLDVSRETPRTWAVGTRGSTNFPVHLAVVGQQRVWRWADIFVWAQAHGRLPADEPQPLGADTVTRLNAQLLDGYQGSSPALTGGLVAPAR